MTEEKRIFTYWLCDTASNKAGVFMVYRDFFDDWTVFNQSDDLHEQQCGWFQVE